MAYRPDRGWGFAHQRHPVDAADGSAELDDLRRRISELESSLKKAA